MCELDGILLKTAVKLAEPYKPYGRHFPRILLPFFMYIQYEKNVPNSDHVVPASSANHDYIAFGLQSGSRKIPVFYDSLIAMLLLLIC